MFSAVLTEHWLSFCGLLSWILVWRFDSAHGHLWGATDRSLCCQGSDPERVQASSVELWGALCGRSESSGLWPGGSRWDRKSPSTCTPPHGHSSGRWELVWLSSDRRNSGKKGVRFQQLLGLLQRIGNTVSKMDFLLIGGERGGEVWVQFLMKTVFSEVCCPVLGAMEPLPVYQHPVCIGLSLFLSWILAWRWTFSSSRLCRLKQKPHCFPCKKVPVNLISEKLRLKFNQDLV